MQLIIETEASLDMEPNMSTVKDLPNKMETIDIDVPKTNKCLESNDVMQVDTEKIEENLEDIPITIENNVVDIIHPNVSIISEKKCIEAESVQDKELKNSDSIVVNETNNLDINEKENKSITVEIPEDDYLEDDIISIRDEAIITTPDQQKNIDSEIKKTDDAFVDESLHSVNDKMDVDEKLDDSHNKVGDDITVNKENDFIELIEEDEQSTVPCENKAQEEFNIAILEAMIKEDGEQIESSVQEGQTSVDVIDKKDVSIQDDIVETQCLTESINENQNSRVQNMKETEIEKRNEISKDKSPILCENKLDSPVETSVQEEEDINIIEEHSDFPFHCDDKSDPSVEQIQIITEVEKNIIQCEDKSRSPVREENKFEDDGNPDVVSVETDADASTNIETSECLIITKTTEADKTINLKKTNEENVTMDIVDSEMAIKDAAITSQTITETNIETNTSSADLELKLDVQEVVESTPNVTKENIVNNTSSINKSPPKSCVASVNQNTNNDKPIICKLSNTLDILSDEEEEPVKEAKDNESEAEKEKQCINIDDDDDIMLIDEDPNKIVKSTQSPDSKHVESKDLDTAKTDSETGEKTGPENRILQDNDNQKETVTPVIEVKNSEMEVDLNEKTDEITKEHSKTLSPLIPDSFLTAAKTKFADMTREDLEEFCVLKIVESIVDRTSLSDIKNKLKEMTQGLEDYRKKAMLLTKQNRDLQVVLKSIQEEQKKEGTPITPLKITRSVGVQVFMDKAVPRKKVTQQNVNTKNTNTPQNKNGNAQGRSPCQPKPANQNIPVPRLVPAYNPALKTPNTPQANQPSTPNKNANSHNGPIKNPSPILKADKRPHSKMASGETVDLTDDEPPAKVPGGPKAAIAPPVRVVPSQNLMAPQRQPFVTPSVNGRKVYIPINGPPNQVLRPGQTIMFKTTPTPGIRPRCPTPQRTEAPAVKVNRVAARHPAPLPLPVKQYQPPNWKSLPPAPDLKLSKVENGIVISWKIEDIPEDSYEEIASYQLFAYQETSLPANTALWKKIGDVKALPLPMACTLTQFMAGFKYYFAVRAIDIRSRIGPFSLPGSILLLNKNI